MEGGLGRVSQQVLAETVQVFESAAAAFPRADYRPAWIYWSGRARDRMGDSTGARIDIGLP